MYRCRCFECVDVDGRNGIRTIRVEILERVLRGDHVLSGSRRNVRELSLFQGSEGETSQDSDFFSVFSVLTVG